MAAFKAPEPEPMEHFDHYLRRVIAAFESWVNENFKPGEPNADA